MRGQILAKQELKCGAHRQAPSHCHMRRCGPHETPAVPHLGHILIPEPYRPPLSDFLAAVAPTIADFSTAAVTPPCPSQHPARLLPRCSVMIGLIAEMALGRRQSDDLPAP